MTPNEYNKLTLANLDGTGPVDWDAAKKAFKIGGWKPEKLNILPREEILQKVALASVANNAAELAPPQKIAANSEELRNGTPTQRFLRLIARQYVQLENKNARLPKFTKWCASLFKDDDELLREIAKLGQQVVKQDANGDGLIISCNPVDILRAADTQHYWSCLYDGGAFKDVLKKALTECSGIAVAYVNGADGKMKGRIFIHAGKDENGKPCVILANRYGNGITSEEIAKKVAAAGYDCYQYQYAWYGHEQPRMNLQFIGCFKNDIHWDTVTWDRGGKATGNLLAKAA